MTTSYDEARALQRERADKWAREAQERRRAEDEARPALDRARDEVNFLVANEQGQSKRQVRAEALVALAQAEALDRIATALEKLIGGAR